MALADSSSLEAFLETLPTTEELFDKCFELGLVMHRPPEGVHPVGLTLSPFILPRQVLYELFQRQILWNELIDRMARDFTFLHTTLRAVGETDKNFTGRLLRILEDVYLDNNNNNNNDDDDHHHRQGKTKKVYQKLMLGILRSDYMQAIKPDNSNNNDNNDVEQWKNVEINTISCSFAGLSPLVSDFHAYLRLHRDILHGGEQNNSTRGTFERSISGERIPFALASAVQAWRETVPLEDFSADYGANYKNKKKEKENLCNSGGLIPVVLVVAQEGERNVADVRKLLFELLKTHRILGIIRTLRELHESLELITFSSSFIASVAVGDGELGAGTEKNAPKEEEEEIPPFAVVEGRYLAAVVYFRSTYVPGDFPDDVAWQTRTALERSNAVKCPSLPYHLMTFKKLQQRLTDVDGVLGPRGFDGAVEKAHTLAGHFMPQYSLDAEEYAEARRRASSSEGAVPSSPRAMLQAAIDDPDAFVLKPQLEGGGNLFYGEAMRRLLRDVPVEDPRFARIRREFILMRKIRSPVGTTVVFREKALLPLVENALSELGIFGVVLSDGEGWRLNEPAGYVLRTKPASIEDGGVIAGNACLNSIVVV